MAVAQMVELLDTAPKMAKFHFLKLASRHRCLGVTFFITGMGISLSAHGCLLVGVTSRDLKPVVSIQAV